jgi:hypothetical protein
MSTYAQPHGLPTQQICISLSLTGESYRVSHRINSLHRGEQYTHHMGTFTPHRGTHIVSSQMTHPSHGNPPHIGAHNIPYQSQRRMTHPTHGLSHRPTHSVYVLEDVSQSCNNQHVGDVKKKGPTRSSVDPKLRKIRDLRNLLIHKKIPPRKKEGMCTWLLQAHMQIMWHGWLNQVHPFL